MGEAQGILEISPPGQHLLLKDSTDRSPGSSFETSALPEMAHSLGGQISHWINSPQKQPVLSLDSSRTVMASGSLKPTVTRTQGDWSLSLEVRAHLHPGLKVSSHFLEPGQQP